MHVEGAASWWGICTRGLIAVDVGESIQEGQGGHIHRHILAGNSWTNECAWNQVKATLSYRLHFKGAASVQTDWVQAQTVTWRPENKQHHKTGQEESKPQSGICVSFFEHVLCWNHSNHCIGSSFWIKSCLLFLCSTSALLALCHFRITGSKVESASAKIATAKAKPFDDGGPCIFSFIGQH